MNRPVDLTGRRGGKLTALRRGERHQHWIWQCECGGSVSMPLAPAARSPLASCGCAKRQNLGAGKRRPEAVRHGLLVRDEGVQRRHPVWSAWSNMHQRCYNPHNPGFPHYGGRGITVCPRWHDAAAFAEDMAPAWEAGLWLERVNNDAGYEPENCRWTSRRDQMNNRQGTLYVERDGAPVPRAIAAEREGFGRDRHALRVEAFTKADRPWLFPETTLHSAEVVDYAISQGLTPLRGNSKCNKETK